GSEDWGIPIKLKEEWKVLLGFLPSKLATPLAKSGIFTIPGLPMRMAKFRMLVDIYHPDLKKEELLSDEERLRSQLWFEAEKLHRKMKEMQVRLKGI
ncbi:MAG: hypothetical protein AB7O96_03880, partial [Pseudobdellovibrionaceae bacterium]